MEARLLEHPGVAQAVVVAAPDADGLDKPVAFVVRAGARATEEELIAFCRDALAAFKRPRAVFFLETSDHRDGEDPAVRPARRATGQRLRSPDRKAAANAFEVRTRV